MSKSEGHMLFAAQPAPGAAPDPAGGSEASQVCLPNISTAERRKRLLAGAIELAISLGILAALLAGGASRWWRLPLFLLFWGAAGGFFQWRDRT
jgi:hypothetical protein